MMAQSELGSTVSTLTLMWVSIGDIGIGPALLVKRNWEIVQKIGSMLRDGELLCHRFPARWDNDSVLGVADVIQIYLRSHRPSQLPANTSSAWLNRQIDRIKTSASIVQCLDAPAQVHCSQSARCFVR
jgi:hypothetical protein